MVIFRCLPASDGTETEYEGPCESIPVAGAPASSTVPNVGKEAGTQWLQSQWYPVMRRAPVRASKAM